MELLIMMIFTHTHVRVDLFWGGILEFNSASQTSCGEELKFFL